MRPQKRPSRMLVVLGLLLSLMTAFPGVASAAESVPPLQWPAVQIGTYSVYSQSETSPQGEITLGCNAYSDAEDLITYDSTGNEVRRLLYTEQVDGVANCIYNVAVGKNGDLYGSPGKGHNLLAYHGNTLKWKYPLGCTYYMANPAVGADGNIYAINNSGRLIGLTPEVEPGTAQPKKVLDVPVTNARCNTTLLALRDGLVAIQDMKTTFYNYSGANLGSPPNDVYVREEISQISATGRVFYDKYLESNSLRSATLSAYDYGRNQVMWTTTVSTDGSYVYSAAPFATPDGGAIVYLREKEKDAFGAWTGRMGFSLVKLNAAGVVRWRKTLPLTNAGDDAFGEAEIKVDVNGNIIVVRNGKLKTNDPYKGYIEGISIAVFKSSDGTILYDQLMRGNLDKNSGEVTGYSLKGSTLQPAQNTLYFAAQSCGSGGCFSTIKLYPIKVMGLGLDYPRGAVIARTPRLASLYVAFGDSFTSGEGVPPFEVATTLPGVNMCHRSTNAYPRLIAGTSSKIPSLGSDGFRACSGAVTSNITDSPQWNEGTQLDLWPDATTQLVTLTIGGNDIGFGSVIETCAWPLNDCNAAFQTANQKVINLGDVLKKTYAEILSKMPNARVLVIGYPPMFTKGPGCVVGPNQTDYPFYSEDRKQTAINLLNALNNKIHTSVDVVRGLNQDYFDRLTYVDAAGTNSPFIGHDVCSSDPYFNGLILQNTTYSFHLKANGQAAYAQLVNQEFGK